MADIQGIQFIPRGLHQQLSSVQLSVAYTIDPVGVTGAGDANKVLVQAQAQNVRFGLSVSAPSSVFGFQITAGDQLVVIPIGAGTTLRVIAETAGAVLDYQLGV